jgi:hypothetical protein
MYTGPILLTGRQIATLTGRPTNQGNPGDPNFGIVMPGAKALDDDDEDVFRLVWHQNVNSTDTSFRNGQGWRLERYDGDGDPATDRSDWEVEDRFGTLFPRNDFVSGLGDGDDYIVFETSTGRFLLFDIRGNLPEDRTTLVYRARDENGDPKTGDNDGALDFRDAYAAYCFCAGTLIATARGPVAVEALCPGDLLVTLDRGLQPLRWIGRREVSRAAALAFPALRPIRIAAGALGPGQPGRDLWLSPQHRVLVRSRIARRMTGRDEVLVAAKHLCGLPGIARDDGAAPFTYLHLRLDRHEVVLAEGAWAETLLVGAQALRAMDPAARQELQCLFPDLVPETASAAARGLMPGRAARRLALRHLRQARALVAAGVGAAHRRDD